jgi:ApaG protein
MSNPTNEAPQMKVKVAVSTRYLPDHLPEESHKYAFAYQISIMNENSFAVTLQHRYWLITDANGKESEVSGDGVVGKQPRIPAGETFVYSSGAVIETKVGTMQGYYDMEAEDGTWFKAPIAPFLLAVPNIVN